MEDLRTEKVISDEQLLLNSVTYHGYEFTRNKIRLNSNKIILYSIYPLLIFLCIETEGKWTAWYKCSKYQSTGCNIRLYAVVEHANNDNSSLNPPSSTVVDNSSASGNLHYSKETKTLDI